MAEEYVWVLPKNGKTTVPIGACILARDNSRIQVRDDDHNEYWVSQKEILRPMHPTSVLGVEDMTYLEELQEYSILRNLQIRYGRDLIYTYVGSILVAVNPYKPLPIYGKDKMLEYRKRKLGELPPHVFAVADHSYESMRKMSEKRCIVVSGESGGGKTESTKLFLQYFATISPKLSGKERQILDSNPILEAFGNAKTVCNDNSSRFGKYISIYFNVDGSIHSAEIKHYLLEKSRIISQSNGEDNYHIFYALLAGLAEDCKEYLGLRDVSSYKYLSGAYGKRSQTIESNSNRHIDSITSAMKVLNFSESEILSIFELIAVILHFGNIDFETILVSNVETVEAVARDIQIICSLLQVSEERLKDSLTKKTISTQGDNVVRLLSEQEAINSRDAFVKKIFGNLFNFIVEKINENLMEGKKNTQHHIGILDIFGFEAFDRNSFEQLCINYANEKLQQFFIGHVFKLEQEQYASEGIIWKFVDYPDNKEILDLIEDGPQSVLSVINDSTKIPRGTDDGMLEKLIELHSGNPFFLKPKFKSTPVFGIQHFAGIVLYDTKDFIEKNYDSYSTDIKQVVHDSRNQFLRRIFASEFEADSVAYYKKRLETLASKFKSSLDSLMNELNECQPFFVRCIKPNEVKKPEMFDRMLCCRQLKYSGMMEVTKVREAGYPVRYNFFQFVQRYEVLVPDIPLTRQLTDCKSSTERICQAVFRNFSKPDYQLGRTKIFLKHAEEMFLEAEREKALYSSAVVVQKLVRGWLVRRRFLRLKKAVALAEEFWMERCHRAQGLRTRHGFYRLQAKIKSRALILQLQRRIHLVTRLQARCRGYLIRKSTQRKLKQSDPRKKASGKPTDSAEFKDFAKKHFQGNQKWKYSRKPIKTSLTRLIRAEEVAAAKALWLTILRYTRNVPEPPKDVEEQSASLQIRQILVAITEISNDLVSETKMDSSTKADNINRLYEHWGKMQTTEMEKLQFVIGHGIMRSSLRDEIYCQICKILTKNPSKKANHRGWELLSCCVGCFPPSDLFLQCLKAFIRVGHKRYTSFCLFRLHRVMQNGCRTRPPFTTELQAIKRQKPVELEVFLKNSATTLAKIDSSTTAAEMLDMVGKNIRLTDTMGFSLVLVQETKHLSLGDGSGFVLDAVSECEQYVAEVEGGWKSVPWKLYLKKEMFAPWHDFFGDEVSTKLIYHQIKEGIVSGEYGFEDPDLASVVAQVCYAEGGVEESLALRQIIWEHSPPCDGGFSSDDFARFQEKVEDIYRAMFTQKDKALPNDVRTAVVKHAALNWTLHFSRFFNVFGSIRKTKGTQNYPEVPLVVGVNFSGILVIDETSEIRIIAEMEYPEIQDVTRKELSEGDGYVLTVTSYAGMEVSLVFQSTLDNDFHQLLSRILQTLRKRSKFVMAVKDNSTTDKSFLELRKGDLLILSEKFCGEDLLHNSWGEGSNDRTGTTGNFLLQCVEIIPAVQRPSESVLTAMRDARFHGKRNHHCQMVDRHKHYTLESYANKFFERPHQQDMGEKATSKPSELWKYSKRRIQHPLLAKLASNPSLAAKALTVFDAILLYEENHQEQGETEEQLTRRIFGPGLENNDMKDETYCQIMKQLTSNPDKNVDNKTWELMWLLTGLFGCEETLANEVKKFLQSRRTIQIARDCLSRFSQVLHSEPRKCSPHFIEVDAVTQRPCRIFHRIFFPDGSNKFFKIHSLTKFKELREIILGRLNLTSREGFCLFIEFLERLFLAPDNYYVFDYLQNFEDWTKMKKTSKTKCQYKIYFMKYTWKALSSNKIINLKFIFPQEYNKYIQGFYDIPTEDVIQLAAMLYGVHFARERIQQQQFQKVLEKLIPSKAVNLMKLQKWQEEIQNTYRNHHSSSSEDECKIKFLQFLSKFTSQGLPYFALTTEKSNMKNYMLYSVTHRPAS